MNETIMELFSSNGFWTIIGILIGGSSNLLVWIIQNKIQQKNQVVILRQSKIEEIADFCNILDERIKTAHAKTITGDPIKFWIENSVFWSELPHIKIKVMIQAVFPKCSREYDELQLSISKFTKYIAQILGQQQYSSEVFFELENEINQKRNVFLNELMNMYFKNT